jgi:ABC-2 type transport system ATP-binding protein
VTFRTDARDGPPGPTVPGPLDREEDVVAPSAPAVQTASLTKAYGSRRGVVDLDLVVERGAVVGFLGPNGAGKSTTLRLLVDLLRPTSGSVRVLGEDPRAGGAVLRRRIGYLAGDLVLPARMTGQRVVDLLLELSGSSPARTRSRVLALADRLDLELAAPTRALSKGNRQKVGLLAAFAHDPELLLLDEPTSGLDPLLQQTFHTLVREAAERGASVLMSSHVLSEVEQTADRVAVLREGRLVASSSVAALRAEASRRVEVEVVSSANGAGPAHDLALTDARDAPALHGGRRVHGSFPGDPADLVARLAAAPWRDDVLDLVVEAPDLETAVLRLYEDDA